MFTTRQITAIAKLCAAAVAVGGPPPRVVAVDGDTIHFDDGSCAGPDACSGCSRHVDDHDYDGACIA